MDRGASKLQSMGLQRVTHDCATNFLSFLSYISLNDKYFLHENSEYFQQTYTYTHKNISLIPSNRHCSHFPNHIVIFQHIVYLN